MYVCICNGHRAQDIRDAAATGILDCDMTGGAYQTGKNPAFQFVGDIMGGYSTPYQQLSWLYYGGGLEMLQEIYPDFQVFASSASSSRFVSSTSTSPGARSRTVS